MSIPLPFFRLQETWKTCRFSKITNNSNKNFHGSHHDTEWWHDFVQCKTLRIKYLFIIKNSCCIGAPIELLYNEVKKVSGKLFNN